VGQEIGGKMTGKIRGEKRALELLWVGCPQCKQREEFKIIKEKRKERTYEVFSRSPNEFRTSFSDDDSQEHIIFCPACEWKEDVK